MDSSVHLDGARRVDGLVSVPEPSAARRGRRLQRSTGTQFSLVHAVLRTAVGRGRPDRGCSALGFNLVGHLRLQARPWASGVATRALCLLGSVRHCSQRIDLDIELIGFECLVGPHH